MTAPQHKSLGEALAAAAADIAAKGVGKTGTNVEQRYKYRPIDEVLNVVGPAIARHGITVATIYDEREARVAGKTAKGNDRTRVTLRCTCVFRHHSEAHARHEVVTIGEAEDSADKATNKAMAMGLKYALVTAFLIPVIGSDDADADNGHGDKGGALTDHAYDSHCAAIDAAATRGELVEATKAALTAATAAGDNNGRAALKARSFARAAALGLPAKAEEQA
jgi:hypothetical protein